MWGWWISKAARLQREVKDDELNQLENGLDQYRPDEVRQAVVHARQDVVLLASYLSSINSQLWTVKIMLLGLLGLLIYIAARIS